MADSNAPGSPSSKVVVAAAAAAAPTNPPEQPGEAVDLVIERLRRTTWPGTDRLIFRNQVRLAGLKVKLLAVIRSFIETCAKEQGRWMPTRATSRTGRNRDRANGKGLEQRPMAAKEDLEERPKP